MKFNRYAFVLACATIANSNSLKSQDDPFASMQKSMQIMQEEMQEMFNSMQNMNQTFFSSAKNGLASQQDQGINIVIDSAANNATKVIISGIQAEQFEATFGDKELTVKAPSATIQLSYHHGQLSASVSQENKEEVVDEKTKTTASQQLFASSSTVRQLIAKPVDLENAAIDFNKENKTLTITLPAKERTKAAKNIPVNIK
jgi:HSP20 family molecular chaperone IbpA